LLEKLKRLFCCESLRCSVPGNDSGPASELDHQSSVGEDAEYEEQDANCISSIGDGYPVSPLPNFDHDSSPLSKKPRVDNSLGRVAAPVVHGMQSRRKNEANKVESDRGDDAMNASPLVHNGTSARSFAYRNYNSNGGSHSHTFLHYPYSHPMMTPSYFPPSSLCMGRMGPSLLAANPYFPYPVPSSPEHQRHPPSQDSNESQDPKVAPAQLSGDAATSVQNSEEGSQASSLAGWGSTSTDPCSLIQLQCTPIMAGAGLNRGMMMMPVSHPTGATLYTFGNAGVAAHCYPSSTLGMPLSLHVDTESLSEYQVLVRRQLELFSASVEDVDSSTQGRKKAVKPGQGTFPPTLPSSLGLLLL
jgi:hypothetical protein